MPQLIGLHRLLDAMVHAEPPVRFARGRVVYGAMEQDDRQAFGRHKARRAEPPGGLESVDLGHVIIHDDEVEVFRADGAERLVRRAATPTRRWKTGMDRNLVRATCPVGYPFFSGFGDCSRSLRSPCIALRPRPRCPFSRAHSRFAGRLARIPSTPRETRC